MSIKKQYTAFTLVELIVVITILTILGTIAFISLQGYSANSRDSTRISDMGAIKTSLDLYHLDAGNYPNPTLGVDITYSGGTVWTQGNFGENTFSVLDRLDKIPKDPLTDKEYTYSITSKKNEYELGGIMEGDEIGINNDGITQIHAGEISTLAYVTGNYNGQMSKSNSGTICYILATPTIITNDTNIKDLEEIVTNNNFVYGGYKNLPSSFAGSKFKQNGGFDFQPNKLLAYTDNNNCEPLTDKTNYSARVSLLKGLQDAYSGTILKDDGEIRNLLTMLIDTGSPSSEVINYAGNYINNIIGGEVPVTSYITISGNEGGSTVDNVDFETEDGYSVSEGIFNRTTDEKNEGSYSIASGNHDESSVSCFEISRTKVAPFNIVFDYKISTSSTWNEYLDFYVDGSEMEAWIGEVDWTTTGYTFNPGTYTFKWCYEKWSTDIEGQDMAWVDNILFTDTENYNISGSFGVDAAGATINACGLSTTADSNGLFSINVPNYSYCADITATRLGYTCSTTVNGPISLTSNISNIAGNCDALLPYNVSGSFGVNASGATIKVCGTDEIADSSGNFTTTRYSGDLCDDITATRSGYHCTTAVNGPSNLTSNVSNISGNCEVAIPFITTWKTDNPGISDSKSIQIPLNTGYYYDFIVDWGDGNIESVVGNLSSKSHTYSTEGTYTVSITGSLPHIYFSSYVGVKDRLKLLNISQWGNNPWKTMFSSFYGAENLTITAIDNPNLTNVTNMESMLSEIPLFNSDISGWDTSNVTTMKSLFYNDTSFNQDIGSWDTSNVTTMAFMFSNATSFNQDIGSWDTGNVTTMAYLFFGNTSFNQDISGWDTSKVTTFDSIFRNTSFNQPIGTWDSGNVTRMNCAFCSNTSFNQPLGNWDTSSVTDMFSMFDGATSFNQDLTNWNTSSVNSMRQMFYGASSFNGDISEWNTDSLTNIAFMFRGATQFNKDISYKPISGAWNTSNLTQAYGAFYQANSFNQNIGNWDTSSVINMAHMFSSATSFNQNLLGWNVDNVIYKSSFRRNTPSWLSGWPVGFPN